MPLTLMVKGLDGLPPHIELAIDQLRLRNTLLIYLHVDGTDLFPDQWLYIHSPYLPVGCLTNFRNRVPELYMPPGPPFSPWNTGPTMTMPYGGKRMPA